MTFGISAGGGRMIREEREMADSDGAGGLRQEGRGLHARAQGKGLGRPPAGLLSDRVLPLRQTGKTVRAIV